MRGLLWTAGVWSATIVLIAPRGARGFFRRVRAFLDRDKVAVLLVLLGTHTNAAVTTAEEVAADPVVLERVLRGGLAGLALLVIVPVLFRRAKAASAATFPGMTAITLYGVVALFSTLYSVFATGTVGKVVELSAGIAIVWAVALRPDARKGLRDMIYFVVMLEAALVVGAAIGFFALPDVFAIPTRREGFLFAETMLSPWSHSNALSASGGLVAAYSLAMVLTLDDRKTRWRWFALLIGSSFGILLASGRQGVLIWLAGVSILLWLMRRRLFVMFLFPAAAGLVVVYWDVLWPIITRGDGPRNIATLTGRTGFWEAAYIAWLDHPLTGFGFGSGGRFVALRSIGRDTISSLHSGYMEALIGVGLLGIIPLAYAMWRVARWSYVRLLERSEVHFAILVVPLFLHATVANGFAAWLKADTVIFMALVALADVWNRRAPSEGTTEAVSEYG